MTKVVESSYVGFLSLNIVSGNSFICDIFQLPPRVKFMESVMKCVGQRKVCPTLYIWMYSRYLQTCIHRTQVSGMPNPPHGVDLKESVALKVFEVFVNSTYHTYHDVHLLGLSSQMMPRLLVVFVASYVLRIVSRSRPSEMKMVHGK